MPVIDVKGRGPIRFPDEMSQAEIQAALEKLPLTDDQVVEAAETRESGLFEKKELDEALELYERYRKIKSKETFDEKWQKAKDIAWEFPSMLGVVRDEIWAGIQQGFDEEADLKKHGRTVAEGVLRGTSDLTRMVAPGKALLGFGLRAQDTYDEHLKKTGANRDGASRREYLEDLKHDYADFMAFRNWDVVREQVRKGEMTMLDYFGLSDYLGNDIYNKLAEAYSYPLDPTAVAGGAGAVIKGGARVSAKVAAKAGATGGKTVGGAAATYVGGKAASAGEKISGAAAVPEKVVASVAGDAAGSATSAATTAATVVGGSAVTAPVTAGKAAGAALKGGGEALEALGETTGKVPLPGGGVFDQIAAAKGGTGKAAGLSSFAAAIGGNRIARVTGGAAKGGFAGGVVGGALGSLEALREKHFLETAVPGVLMGGVLGGLTGGGVQSLREVTGFEFRSQVKRNTAEWMASKSEVEVARLKEVGLKQKDFDRLALIERVVAGSRGDDVLFTYLTDDEFKALSGGRAQGTFMYEGIDGKPTVAINLERAKKPGRTIYHEVGHALDMLDFEPEAKRRLNDVLFGRIMGDDLIAGPEVVKEGLIPDSEIPKLAEQYGIGALEGLSSDPMLRRQQIREAIGKEIRAEAWANMLEGKSLRRLGANGWISKLMDGVVLADTDSRLMSLMNNMIPGSRSGSEGIFTIGGKEFHNTPEVNKLLTSLFRAKRRLNSQVTLQEKATKGANIITQKDFTPKTAKVLADVFQDADIFARDENGQILNQSMQPLNKFGGMPKFLSKGDLREVRKNRAAAIHKALMDAGTPEAGTAMGRNPFFLFNDPTVRAHKKSNGLGQFFNEAQMNALRKIPKNIMPPGLLAKLEVLNQASMDGGGTQFAFMYNAALKDTGKYSSSLSNEYRQGVVLDFELTTAGNLNVRTLDMVALHNRLSKLAGLKRNDEDFWKPWGGMDKALGDGEFMNGFFSYLENHRARTRGDTEVRGWTGLHSDEFKARRMRDVYNELIGWRGRDESNPLFGTLFKEKDNPLKSRRLDRINAVNPLESMPKVFINQALQRQNFMPETVEAPVIRDLSEIGEGTPGRLKFEDKPHPKNEAMVTLPDGSTTHSRTRPSRDPLGEAMSTQIPEHLRFENVGEMMQFVDRGVKWLRERMDQLYTPGDKWFYEKMYLAGARLAGDAADKTDLFVRFLAYLSPRTAVPANYTKAFGSGISTFMQEIARGNKAGSLAQIRAISQIIDEWSNSLAFGDETAGVDNKVENFYLNGMAEMLRDYREQGKPVPEYLLQDPRFTDPIELSRLSTNDMWHMAAMAALDPKGGNVWPGFVLKKDKNGKTTGFAWSDTRVGRRVRLDSAEGRKVMRHLAVKGEKGSKKPDPNFGIQSLSKQEIDALDYKADDNSILVFDDKTDAGLNAKGEGPLYDHVQMITGLIADQINAEGGIAGRPTVDAYNIQELMWAAIKMDNPLKEMRDYESYLAPVDEFLKYVESGLELEMPKSIKAATASYDRWARQLVSGEIDSQQVSSWTRELEANRDRLAAQGVADPDQVIIDSIAEGLPMQIEQIVAAHGLDARVDTVRTDIGAYLEDGVVKSNWAIYVQGRGADFGKIDNMLRGAAAQEGGSHVRPLKVEERSLIERLRKDPKHPAPKGFDKNVGTVLEIAGAADMTPDQVRQLVADLAQLKDGNGNSFMSGLSKVDDKILIHDGYYRGEWTSEGFNRYSFFDKKTKNSKGDMVDVPDFDAEVNANKALIKQLLAKHGLTVSKLGTNLVGAESNPYIKSGKDTIKRAKLSGRKAKSSRKVQPGAEERRDIQGVSFLRGHYLDASRNAGPSQKPVKYDADQIAEIRKTISRSSPPLPKRIKSKTVESVLEVEKLYMEGDDYWLTSEEVVREVEAIAKRDKDSPLQGAVDKYRRSVKKGGDNEKALNLFNKRVTQIIEEVKAPKTLPKLSKSQSDSLRQLGSDAGVLSAVANSDLVPSSINPALAGKIFDSVMALAENNPAKLLKSYDKRFMDLQTPYLKEALKQGVKDLTAEGLEFKQEYQKTIREINRQLKLKRSNKPKLKGQLKSAEGTLAKGRAANDALIKKAEADGIITRNQASVLHRRIGTQQDLMPDVVPVPRRYLGSGGEQHPFFSRAFDLSQPAEGGRYFDMGSRADVTGQTYLSGVVSTVGGKRKMNVSDELAESVVARKPKEEGKLARINLFDSKKTGWKWSKNKPADAPDTVVSVEQGNKHYYALTTESAQPVDLATYPKKKSEPRLRPTTRGKVVTGKKVGEFIYQGKRRTVYDTVKIVSPQKVSPRQEMMPSDAFYPAETTGALRVLSNELGYRVTHTADSKYRLYDTSGVLMGVAASKQSLSNLYKRRVVARRN